jgi:Cu(I)/Ag(I) efflux system protein CusF
MKKIIILAAAAFIGTFAGAVFAQGAQGSHAGHADAPSSAAAAMTDGEVRKVDKEAGKITIRHGELKNLGMGAMTMVFRAKDPAMLNQVKVGDKIKFAAEKVDGAITVVAIEPVK